MIAIRQTGTGRPDGLPDRVPAVAAGRAEGGPPQRVWLVPDGTELPDGASLAEQIHLPQRNDLPAGHPRRGQRLLPVVPSGWPDCTVVAGRLTLVDDDGDPAEATP